MIPSRQAPKGIALLQALFAVGMIGLISGVALQHIQVQRQFHQLQQAKEMRNQISKQLSLFLYDPEVLLTSAQISGGDNPGNALLLTCSALDAATLAGCAKAGVTQEGTPFLLAPAATYVYPLDKGKFGNANCLDPTSRSTTSCYLAGTYQGHAVGYSLRGAVGELGPEFPLEARAFFRPYCLTEDAFGNAIPQPANGESCALPRGLEVGYQIWHHQFDRNGGDTGQLGTLGVYPKAVGWHVIPATLLHGQTCNTGASISAVDPKGFIECTCMTPYRPTGKLNANGPLCELEAQMCPPGSLLIGHKADSTAICVREIQSNYQTWTQLIKVGNYETPYGSIDCRTNAGKLVEGWVAQLNQKCDTSYVVQQKDVPNNASLTKLLIGGSVGATAGLLAALVISLFTGNFPVVIAIVLVLVAAALGAVIAWQLGIDYDWVLLEASDPLDANNAQDFIPSIRCEIQATCKAFLPSTVN